MRYFEDRNDVYILAYGICAVGGSGISAGRYNAILSAVENRPQDTETISYRLRTDLTWEPVSVEPAEDDIDEAEAYEIIFGGNAG